MCGISGCWDTKCSTSSNKLVNSVKSMLNSIYHRGPDGSGIWLEEKERLCFGHRRLSIVDLSSNASQPMHSYGQRYTITYNGEIYNFKQLRSELEATDVEFNSTSDTEVLLASIEIWGMMEALEKFVGMFAFALWDRKLQTLHLVRDRLGEKPLYYGWQGDFFLFASELSAMTKHFSWQGNVDRNALAEYIQYGYVPSPNSIYKKIYKLQPGTILSIQSDYKKREYFSPLIQKSGARKRVSTKPYWSAKEIALNGIKKPFMGTEEDAKQNVETLLKRSVHQQMISDVPFGAFLSGGIDSSLIVSLMQENSNQPVKTFTIGFDEHFYNEAKDAKKIASFIGTEHSELYVSPNEALNVIPKLPLLYSEPFADSSQIPTYLVSKLTKGSVTVSLSGDGGDELFGGYNRYFIGPSLWKKMGFLSTKSKKKISAFLSAVPPKSFDDLFHFLAPILPRALKFSMPGDKIHKLAKIITSKNFYELYLNLISQNRENSSLVLGVTADHPKLVDQFLSGIEDFSQLMMCYDLLSYLPDDILVKVDRAAMGVSLETRTPYLDHRLVAFAWKLPLSMKIKNGEGKWLLRQLLYRYVPKKLVERPKMGFAVPLDTWLRGPLKTWAEDLLDTKRLDREGFFDAKLIRRIWEEHIQGRRNWQYLLWNVLMFQAWNDSKHTLKASPQNGHDYLI